MRYRIRHKNRYHYGQSVSLCHSLACLLPRDTLNQRVLNSRLIILPVPEIVKERVDLFGNRISRFSIEELHDELNVVAESEVEVQPTKLTPNKNVVWSELPSIPPKTRLYLKPSTFVPQATAELINFGRKFFVDGRGLVDAVSELCQIICQDFEYDPLFSEIETSVNLVFSERRGVCQDFAHLMLSILRFHGIPARYVSGYLETDPPADQPKLMGSDASHAWVSVFIPGTGWLDFDPTNNLLPSDRHVTLAWGRDYSDIVPLKGLMTGGAQHGLEVSVDVTPLEY